MKKFSVLSVAILSAGLMAQTPHSSADYPAVPGVTDIRGTATCPVAIDLTPKSIPANTTTKTLSLKAKSLTTVSGKPLLLKVSMPNKSRNAAVSITCGKTTRFPALKIDSKGILQLPTFALFADKAHVLKINDGKVTRTITINVK